MKKFVTGQKVVVSVDGEEKEAIYQVDRNKAHEVLVGTKYFIVPDSCISEDFSIVGNKIEHVDFKNTTIPVNRKEDSYDYINPTHYLLGGKETFDMMVQIWGTEKAIAHCEMCAFKYQMRLGKKPGQPVERDMAKIKWYEDKAKELKETIKQI